MKFNSIIIACSASLLLILDGAIAHAQLPRTIDHLAVGQSLVVQYASSPHYSGGGANALIDGLRGNPENTQELWQGYQGDDLIATIDLGAVQQVAEIRAGFLRKHEAHIFIPKRVAFSVSQDGEEFKEVATFTHDETMTRAGWFARDFSKVFQKLKTRYVRIHAENVGFCPDWHKSARDQAWLFCDELIVNDTQVAEQRGELGKYFHANSAAQGPIPTFAESRSRLPQPVLDGNPEWVEMYWYCWEQAFKGIKTPEPGSGFVAQYIDEAFNPNIFQWDTHFMLEYWKYAHHIFDAIRSHDNFYAKQHSDGYICREIREADGTDFVFQSVDHTINPPLFAQIEWDWFWFTGKTERIEQVFPVLEHYGYWIDANRVYPGTSHALYWNTNFGSGMDNSPRQGMAWVDMSSQMAMHYEVLASMALYLNEEQKNQQFSDLSRRINSSINHFMWNAEDGMYYDLDPLNNHERIPTIASFWPLWAGIAKEERADELIGNLLDEQQFLSQVPFRTLSMKHESYYPQGGDYWRGGVWAPTNYMLDKGLKKANYYNEAYLVASSYLDAMASVYKQTGTVWENYAPDQIKEGNKAKRDFVGWSGLGPISMLIESVIGIEVAAPMNTINWRINRLDNHGVRNLRFKDQFVTLMCRYTAGVPELVVVAEKPFLLHVEYGGMFYDFEVEAGQSSLSLNN